MKSIVANNLFLLTKFLDHLPFGVQQPVLLEEKRADVKSKVGNIDFNIITGSLDGIDHLIVCSQYRCCHEMSARQIRSLMYISFHAPYSHRSAR